MSRVMTQALAASVRVLVERRGAGADRRTIRRAVLVERGSGKLIELPTVYIFRAKSQKSLNTQKALLRDLAFFHEWCLLKRARNKNWRTAAERLNRGLVPLLPREIAEFARWCASSARELRVARDLQTRGVSKLRQLSDAPRAATVNRRLGTVMSFLSWLVEELLQSSDNDGFEHIYLAGEIRQRLYESFSDQRHREASVVPVRALSHDEAFALRDALACSDLFVGATGERDRLIIRLLLESGIRAGELLKLQCADISDKYRRPDGRFVGSIEVIRRPNDSHDERKNEPSVKSIPGPIPISLDLAGRLIRYVKEERAIAVQRRVDGLDTPYLFLCHHGNRAGVPISQRNLNRIVTKLKGIRALPEWLTPHVMRHTHFSELADEAYAQGVDPMPLLYQRGRWSPRSGTAERYAERSIQAKAASMNALRQKKLDE